MTGAQSTITYTFADKTLTTKYVSYPTSTVNNYRFNPSDSVLSNKIRMVEILQEKYSSLKQKRIYDLLERIFYIVTDGYSWMDRTCALVEPQHSTYLQAMQQDLWEEEGSIKYNALSHQVAWNRHILTLFSWGVTDKEGRVYKNLYDTCKSSSPSTLEFECSPSLVEFEFGAFFRGELHIYTQRCNIDKKTTEYDLTRYPLRSNSSSVVSKNQRLSTTFPSIPKEFRQIENGRQARDLVLYFLHSTDN